MADRKISELTNLTGANLADDDEFALVDTSADETKAITFGEFKTALDTATGFVRITGDTMTGALDVQSTITADGLTVDGAATITTGDNTAQLTLISTDADANDGPLLVLNRNSSSPADNDKVGQIQFLGEDDASNSTIFGSIVNQIKDASNGSEDGRMSFNLISAGSDRTFFNLTHDGTQAEVVVNEDSRDIDFRVESDGSANALFVQGSSGNVGIGTSSPSRLAELYGTSNPALRLNNGTDVADIGLASSAGALLTGSTSGALVLARGGANAINLGTNGQNRVTIDSSGSVGIGTSSPNSKLSITESTVGDLITVTGANGTDLRIGNHASANGGIYINSQAASDDLRFRTQGSDRMTIDSSGSVGIGTSSPTAYGNSQATLVIEDDGNPAIALSDTGQTRDWFIVALGDGLGIRYADGGGSGSASNLTESAFFKNNGSVGIGTTSPSTRLTVGAGAGSEEIRVDAGAGWADLTLNSNATNGGHIYFNDGSNSGEIFYYHPSDYMAFNTAGSEAMRLDASGNLLVGKTTIATGTAGVALRSNGEVRGTVSGAEAARFSRLSSDGAIVGFEKDGTSVGSIGANSGDLMIGTGDTGMRFSDGEDSFVPSTITGNANRDNAIDLGKTSSRFKDLYLSGGVYLGGTGAANQLDDYEEGTWTPVMKDSTANQVIATTSTTANYTKIGRLVWVNVETTRNTGSSFTGTLKLTGLPFLASNRSGYSTNNGSAWFDGTGTDDVTTVHGGRNSTHVLFKKVEENSSYLGSAEFENTRPVYLQFWYMATDGD